MEISVPDSKNFGMNIARAYPKNIHEAAMSEKYCMENMVGMMITRIPTNNIKLVHELECRKYSLMDTLIYWNIDLENKSTPTDVGEIPIRPATQNDCIEVKNVIYQSFEDYYGHYHMDDRLYKQDCTRAYSNWAERHIENNKPAVVAYDKDKIVGAGMIDQHGTEAEYILGGVLPSYQGRKVYKSILVKIIEWCRNNKVKTLIISTQIDNFAVQKVWARMGLEPFKSEYTFHKWFI